MPSYLDKRCIRSLVVWPRVIEGEMCWFRWVWKSQTFNGSWKTDAWHLIEHAVSNKRPVQRQPSAKFEAITDPIVPQVRGVEMVRDENYAGTYVF